MFKGRVYVVIDGQAGSCGKGKIVGFLSRAKNVDVSINNNTPNAGHTFVFDDGRKVVTTHMPIAVVNPKTELLIGPGAVITPETLLKEIDMYGDLLANRKIYIHERAAIVMEEHRVRELETIKSGSTFKGTAASSCDKIMRKQGVVLAGSYKWNSDKIVIYNDNLMVEIIKSNMDILIETSQGFDLDINHGLSYPHVTSRGCTVMQALADCGIPNGANIVTYMVFRPYPIRISNESIMGNIYSGDYDDSVELSWDDIEAMSGSASLAEYTTVTKKMRRVFSFSYKRFDHAVTMNNPTYLILNFAQHLDCRILGENKAARLYNLYSKGNNHLYGLNPVLDFVADIEREYGVPIAYIGTGPRESDQIELHKRMRAKNVDELEITGTCMTYSRRHF